jgi:hypothetical protein
VELWHELPTPFDPEAVATNRDRQACALDLPKVQTQIRPQTATAHAMHDEAEARHTEAKEGNASAIEAAAAPAVSAPSAAAAVASCLTRAAASRRVATELNVRGPMYFKQTRL